MLARRKFLAFLGLGAGAAVAAKVSPDPDMLSPSPSYRPGPPIFQPGDQLYDGVIIRNKLVEFRKEITREYVREHLFNPFIERVNRG